MSKVEIRERDKRKNNFLPNKVKGPSPSRAPNRPVKSAIPTRIEYVELLFSRNSAIVKQGVGPGVPIIGAFVGCFEG